MSLAVVLAVLAGTTAAAFVSGLSGFAFGMIALSVWAWVLEPRLLGPMVVFGALVAQLVSLGAMQRSLPWRRLLPFLIGGVVGVPIGVLLLDVVDLRLFRVLTGALLIIYCGGSLLAADLPPLHHGGRIADAIVGAIGGTMGGLAGLSGPAPVLWATLRGWDKDSQRGVFQSFNLAMQALAMLAYAGNGMLTAELGKIFALMLPAILLPAWVGTTLYRRISERAFRRLLLALLLGSGCVLVGSSLIR